MEGKMHLSGQLSDWSINDLLQIMQVTDKTGSLDIKGDQSGRVHFREGRVTGAELTGAKGSYVGSDRSGVADVLYVLSAMDSGSFAVGAADGPEVKGWSVEEIVTEVEALRSLEGEVVGSGLLESAGVRLLAEVDDPVTIQAEDWHFLVNLVPVFTFSQLESELGRGTAVRIFHTLHRLGVAEGFAPEPEEAEETDWLDQVVAELSPEAATSEETIPPAFETAAIAPEEDAEELETVELADERPPVVGVSAPASTTLTDGVYDEIRRLRGRATGK